jgi:hypothetical protein
MAYGYGAVRGKPYGVGRRGGVYWSRAKKPRYDPARFERLRGYGRRARAYGSKAEAIINKHAGKIGVGISALMGIGGAFNSLSKVTYPDNVGNKNAFERYLWLIQNGGITLVGSTGPYGGIEYFKYKFLGIDPSTQQFQPGTSAWSLPFLGSLAAWILAKILPTSILPARIKKPLEGISKGALVTSTVGALFLPGTPPTYPNPASTSNSAPNYTYNIPRTNYVYGK